jgi:hypothetical protein
VGPGQRASGMLMGSHDGRVDREQVVKLLVALGCGRSHGGEHLHVGTVIRPSAMTLPGGLPRAEMIGHIAPLSPRPETPDDAFKRQSVIIPGTTSATTRDRHDRPDESPHIIGNLVLTKYPPASRAKPRISSRHALGTLEG